MYLCLNVNNNNNNNNNNEYDATVLTDLVPWRGSWSTQRQLCCKSLPGLPALSTMNCILKVRPISSQSLLNSVDSPLLRYSSFSSPLLFYHSSTRHICRDRQRASPRQQLQSSGETRQRKSPVMSRQQVIVVESEMSRGRGSKQRQSRGRRTSGSRHICSMSETAFRRLH